MPVTCGVPQSSILCLLLFLIFINDISLEEHLSDICLFADDAVISRPLNVDRTKTKLQINYNLMATAYTHGVAKIKWFLVSKRQTPYLYSINIKHNSQVTRIT